MMKLKAILCFFHRHHKYSYYTDECIRCGKKKERGKKQGDGSRVSFFLVSKHLILNV